MQNFTFRVCLNGVVTLCGSMQDTYDNAKQTYDALCDVFWRERSRLRGNILWTRERDGVSFIEGDYRSY